MSSKVGKLDLGCEDNRIPPCRGGLKRDWMFWISRRFLDVHIDIPDESCFSRTRLKMQYISKLKFVKFLIMQSCSNSSSDVDVTRTRGRQTKIQYQLGFIADFRLPMWSVILAPNDTAYKRWSCHSGFKLLCKLCRTSPPPAMGARFTVFWHAGHADPLDGWRCCSQKRVMSRSIQVRQL